MQNQQQDDYPVLIKMNDDNTKEEILLPSDNVTIGRSEESTIAILERQISRQHIRIYKQDEQYFVQDLDSRNGTWLNNQQIKTPHPINDGDEIQLALVVRLVFYRSNTTAPLGFTPPEKLGGRLEIDRNARRVFIKGEELEPPLSPSQYTLLELLYINAGSVCTRETVVKTVWPDDSSEGISEQAIDALVRRLRDRLSEIDDEHQYIVTMRGHGFRLNNPKS